MNFLVVPSPMVRIEDSSRERALDSRMDTASEEALRPWPWWDDAAATIGASTTWSIDRRIVYRRPTANERCGYKNGGKKDMPKDTAKWRDGRKIRRKIRRNGGKE